MEYGIYARPKLSRNPYNYVYIGGNQAFSSNSIYGTPDGSGSVVGAEMSDLSDFIGATQDVDGRRGLVPMPRAGKHLSFLQATGDWEDIPAYRYIKEWPFDEGLEKTGVGVEGDFHVTDTLSTLNLNVEGQAHFWELVIDKAKMQGGQIFVSPSLFEIDVVREVVIYNTYTSDVFKMIKQERPDIAKYISRYGLFNCRARRCWMKNDDQRDHTTNECEIGDMMRCRTFNLDGRYTQGGLYHDMYNTDWWTFVCGTGTGTFIDDDENEQEGYYIDLAFAFTTQLNNKYYPLDTLFTDDDEPQLPENYVFPTIYDDLKKYTFECLCGLDDVEPEYIEDEDTEDAIIDYDFRIRGITYITAYILGVPYVDDTYATLVNMLAAEGYSNNVLYGSETTQVDDLVYLITGVPAYDSYRVYDNPYVEDVVDSIVEGGDVTISEDGEEDVYLTQNRLRAAERKYWQFGWGIFRPRPRQQLGCLGHMWDYNRQNAIVISAIKPIDAELVAPSIAQYTGIDIFGASISQFRLTAIAKNGNVFTGKFMVKNENAYINVDDMINLYINDIETGLEAVGIHLDGENSTIRMNGSVELHQHSNGNSDTLSVWDNNGRKKVEIIPTEIPTRDNISQASTKSNWSGSSVYDEFVYTTTERQTTHIVDRRFLGFMWETSGHDEYRYRIVNHPVSITNSFNLGSYNKNAKLDITNVSLYAVCWDAKFRQNQYANFKVYGNTVDLILRLKRGNTVVQSKTYNSMQIQTNPNNSYFTVNITQDDYWDNVKLPISGAYTLEYTLQFQVQTDWTAWSTTYYAGSQIYFRTNIRTDGSCDVFAAEQGASLMQIGTNGMVYSVGNGDYFYSGEDGFEFNFKQNKISLNENDGMKVIKIPQTITSSSSSAKTIKSEICVCKKNSSGYEVTFPNAESGRKFNVFGFVGLTLTVSQPGKLFKVYRSDVNAWGDFDKIIFTSNTTEYVSGITYPTYKVNTSVNPALEFITLDDGIYLMNGK